MRSFGVHTARQGGVRDSLKAFQTRFLGDTEMATWWRSAVMRYCREVGVADELVESLFYTCWMHRALKESTRLQPQDLDRGHYLNLLRLCIRERGDVSLGRLLLARRPTLEPSFAR